MSNSAVTAENAYSGKVRGANMKLAPPKYYRKILTGSLHVFVAVAERVDCRTVHTGLEMQVVACGPAGRPDISDNIALIDRLPD